MTNAAYASHPHPALFTDPRNRRDFERARAMCVDSCPRAAGCLRQALGRGDE